MVKKFYFFTIIITLLFTNCRRINQCDKKEKLTFPKIPYKGNNLKIDGYYYNVNCFPKIFYSNGILLSGCYTYSILNQNNIEVRIVSGEFYEDVKNDKTVWSLYTINNDEIKYEFFTRKGALDCYYPVTVSGIILNDTTIEFTQIVNSDGSEPQSISSIWHFKQFSHKPDSTNSFIP